MKKSKISLLVLSILILVMAATSTFFLVGDFVIGEFALDIAEEEAVEKALKIIFGIVIGIQSIVILAQVFIGVKGILECKKPTEARLHIILAKIFAIINVIGAVLGIIGLFDLTEGLFSAILGVAISVIDACIMFCYVKAANEVQGQY